ncbi:hypothetical protein [Marinobacter salsuginis]|uniref:Uncharacterized protein n=1 Tax=Marinobacter salsuginis TaxID=418719 RepID=A0A5M3Q225_9GAMM|nr:hypothetical protein [Marinobacter salsuginis]GBO89172.1 hypothetical protein MSSD14B_28400 [Marinobacter salsuginis]
MSQITIIRNHARVGNWKARIPKSAIARETTIQGVKVIATHRDYFINPNRDNELCYQQMISNDAESFVDLYAEVRPGVFAGGMVASNTNEQWQRERLAKMVGRMSEEAAIEYVRGAIEVSPHATSIQEA